MGILTKDIFLNGHMEVVVGLSSDPIHTEQSSNCTHRLLLVDDNPDIHRDIRKALGSVVTNVKLDALEQELFGETEDEVTLDSAEELFRELVIESAYQGLSAIEMVKQAVADENPYFLAFVDVRMPPGIDGIQTIKELWKIQPSLQVVICTAYSDYSWQEMLAELGTSPNLLILRKPFELIEVNQLVLSTAKKVELQKEVDQHREQLEKLVEERTSSLVETMDQLRVANRVKSQFLATVSHELRTPLTAIIGYSEMLHEQASEAELNEFCQDVEIIQKSSKHLLKMINELLDLSKIEANKMELQVSSNNIQSLFQELHQVVLPLAKKQDNALVIKRAPSAETIETDATRLHQCLLNLLSNACKFTREGTITLSAETAKQNGQDWVEFQVQDTGAGMTQEEQERVFELFFQTKNAHACESAGTGLGLAITQKLCKEMGGEISLKSQPNIGSTFTMRLPTHFVQSR